MIGTTFPDITRFEVASAANTVESIKNMIAVDESGFASKTYSVGDYLRQDSNFYKVTSEISVNDPLVVDGNIKQTTVGYELQHRNDKYHIYGVEWDGSSNPQMTRTDDSVSFSDPNPAVNNGTGSSPFDNLYPWSEMVIEERTGGTMVKIPKFWFKMSVNDTTHAFKLQIADAPVEGFYCSPSHMDRGDGVGERDFVYVGRYHCSSDYTSKTNTKPKLDISISTARTEIHKLGTNIWQYDYATLVTIQMLYLVEFANWNSQITIGYGSFYYSIHPVANPSNMGYTDAMQYHTGTDQESRTIYGGTQYRYIEGLWDNGAVWCDGIYFSGSNYKNIYVVKNPANFSNHTNSVKVGIRPISSGFISAYSISSISGFEWFMYPSEISGSDSTYICDYHSYDTSGTVLFVGNESIATQNSGLFFLRGAVNSSWTGPFVGARLIELPS